MMNANIGGKVGRVTIILTTLSLVSWQTLLVHAADKVQPELNIESKSYVFTYPHTDPFDLTNRYGFNHGPSVIALPDGRLLCCWFSAPYEGSIHLVLLGSFSEDQGRSWQRAFVLQDNPRWSDYDPAFVQDGKRTYFFYKYGRWNRYPFIENEEVTVGTKSFHVFMRYSDDSGRTWSDERKVHETAGCRSNGIKLSSGELLLPVYDWITTDLGGVLKSVDGGKTWVRKEVVDENGVDEPTVAELKNGDILMAVRTGDSHLWTFRSKDKGDTWEKPVKHDMLAGNASHNLFRMSNGRVILTHDECKPPARSLLTMRTTEDGKTWSEPLDLARSLTPREGNDYWFCQVTYPSVCEVPGKVLVIVWAYGNISDTEHVGEIHSARVKILEK